MASSRVWWWIGGLLIVSLSTWFLIIDHSPDKLPTRSFTSLAVLPFESSSADLEPTHLAAGLSFDLMQRLRALGALQLIARGQVLARHQADPRGSGLARQLGAEILVFGKVRQVSTQIALSLEIVDARDGSQIAGIEIAQSRERVFDLQRQAAQEVLEALEVPVRRSESARLRRDPTRSLKAWDYAVQGREYLEDPTNPRGPIFAADLFRRAIQHDPDFAQAHVGLSDALWLGHVRYGDPGSLAEAELEARWVLSRDPRSSSAAVVLAKVMQTATRSQDSRSEQIPEVTRLVKPDEALREIGTGLLQVGKLELAEASWRMAVKLHGDLWLNSYCLGQFLLRGGRYGEAAVAFAKAAEASPPAMTWPTENLLRIKLATADLNGAIQVFETIDPQFVGIETVRQAAAAYAILGNLSAASRVYRQALELDSSDSMLHQEFGDVLTRQNRFEEAEEHYAEGLRLIERELAGSPADAILELRLAVLAAKARNCSRAAPLAATLHRHLDGSTERYYDLALVFALCQDAKIAIDTLRLALNLGLDPERVRSEPHFRELAADADFQALLSQAATVPPSP